MPNPPEVSSMFDQTGIVFPGGVDIGRVLLDRYAIGEHGMWQAGQPLRYGAFGSYGREQMLIDLGPDIDPLQHMPVTELALVELLAGEGTSGDWSPGEVCAGRTAAMLHDIGECTHPGIAQSCAVVGDIPQGEKTEEHRAAEARVRRILYDLYCRDIPDDFLEQVEAIIAHQVTSTIHSAFEAAHDTSTLKVGLRAGRLALACMEGSMYNDIRTEQLRRMAKDVTAGVVARVEHHADLFVYPRRVLDEARPLHSRIQREL